MANSGGGSGQSWLKWVIWALVGLPLLCGGCGLMGFFYIRSESPYGEAVDRATTNSKVVETLGSPVDASFLFSGQIHRTKGQDSISELEIGLSGSKQDGTLYVKGVETGGVWGFSMLRVVARDGTTVNILNR